MAAVTLTRTRFSKRHSNTQLAEDRQLSFSASGNGTGQWTDFSIRVRADEVKGAVAESYYLRFDREQAERLVKYLTEHLQHGPEVQRVPSLNGAGAMYADAQTGDR